MLASVELSTTAALFAVFGALLLLIALSSRLLERLGVPIVLVLLLLGMLGGSEGLGGIDFDDYRFTFRIDTTILQPGDHVYVFARPADRPFIELLFGRAEQEE